VKSRTKNSVDDISRWVAQDYSQSPANCRVLLDEIERLRRRRVLFQLGDFTLRSGTKSRWKIECDAISSPEWETLAIMATELLLPFGSVDGVPSGGVPFANALRRHITPGAPPLIAEDVVTTGGSILRFIEGNCLDAEGIQAIAVFGRGNFPSWIKTIFSVSQ
jgi:orotate phosphoribosyltransferase